MPSRGPQIIPAIEVISQRGQPNWTTPTASQCAVIAAQRQRSGENAGTVFRVTDDDAQEPFERRAAGALTAAASMAGLAVDGEPESIRIGERAVFRLPGGVIGRVARPTRQDAAAREVQVAQWLGEQGVEADQPLPR